MKGRSVVPGRSPGEQILHPGHNDFFFGHDEGGHGFFLEPIDLIRKFVMEDEIEADDMNNQGQEKDGAFLGIFRCLIANFRLLRDLF